MIVGDGIVFSVAQPSRKRIYGEQLLYTVYQVGLYVPCLLGQLVKQSICELLGLHEDRTIDLAGLPQVVF